MLVIFLAMVALALFWVLDVLIRPWAPCRVCGRTGRHGLSTPRAWGDCWACKGRGKRLRFGARVVRRAIGRRKERQ